MTKKQQLRKVERIRLRPHLDGTAANVQIELTEISMGGAKLQHFQPLPVGITVKLKFVWQDEEIVVPASIIRSSVEKYGALSAYISGVRFDVQPGDSKAPLKRLIEHYVKVALDNQVANAFGDLPSYSSRLMQSAAQGDEILSLLGSEPRDIDTSIESLRGEGYVCYSYGNGKWSRSKTWDPLQPAEGFTIWQYEDDDQAEMLCQDYEQASDEIRALIRLCAELSLLADDSIPPQRFIP
jgi:hypothetical protein